MWDYYDIKKEKKPMPSTMRGDRGDTGGSDRNELRELMGKRKFGTAITPKETLKQIEKEFEKVVEDIKLSRKELQRLVQQMPTSGDVYKAIDFLKRALEHLR